jgi:hypothetical protein
VAAVTADATPLPPAGWYPDPDSPGERRRYWDGSRWTDDFGPIEGHYVAHPHDPPRPLDRLRRLAIGGLAVIVLIEAANLATDVEYIAVGERLLSGTPPSSAEVSDAEDLVNAAGVALLMGYLVIGPLTFIPWFHRAYINLPRLGVARLRFSGGWAIGGWFVPILNLWRPKQVANDIYRGSQLGAEVNPTFVAGPVAPLLTWWWALFLIQGFVGQVGGMIIADANSTSPADPARVLDLVEQEQTGFIISAISSGIAIVAAALAIAVVVRLSRDQAAVAEEARRQSSSPIAS